MCVTASKAGVSVGGVVEILTVGLRTKPHIERELFIWFATVAEIRKVFAHITKLGYCHECISFLFKTLVV